MEENKVIHVTDDQFNPEVIESKGLSVVDFWAPWCGPCHTMAPALDTFAVANAGKVKVYKLDVEDNPITQERYEIRSIPTILFFQDGVVVDIIRGIASASTLQERLDAIQSG